jgi:hypothetical protein
MTCHPELAERRKSSVAPSADNRTPSYWGIFSGVRVDQALAATEARGVTPCL